MKSHPAINTPPGSIWRGWGIYSWPEGIVYLCVPYQVGKALWASRSRPYLTTLLERLFGGQVNMYVRRYVFRLYTSQTAVCSASYSYSYDSYHVSSEYRTHARQRVLDSCDSGAGHELSASQYLKALSTWRKTLYCLIETFILWDPYQ